MSRNPRPIILFTILFSRFHIQPFIFIHCLHFIVLLFGIQWLFFVSYIHNYGNFDAAGFGPIIKKGYFFMIDEKSHSFFSYFFTIKS